MVNRNYKVQTENAPKSESKPHHHQHSKQCRARKLEVAALRSRNLHPHAQAQAADGRVETERDSFKKPRRSARSINEKLEKILNDGVSHSNGLFHGGNITISNPIPTISQLPTINESEDNDLTINKVSSFVPDDKVDNFRAKYKYLSPFSDRNADKEPSSGSGNFDRPKFQYTSPDKADENVESAKGYFKRIPGNYPDALYRVSDLADSERGSRRPGRCSSRSRAALCALSQRAWAVVRWPLAVLAICMLLATLFYVMLPDSQKIVSYLPENNSDVIVEYDSELPREQTWSQSSSRGKTSLNDLIKAVTSETENDLIAGAVTNRADLGSATDPVTEFNNWMSTSSPPTPSSTTSTTPESLTQISISTTDKLDLTTDYLQMVIGTKLDQVKNILSLNSHPIYPTNLTPSVQYGNTERKPFQTDLAKMYSKELAGSDEPKQRKASRLDWMFTAGESGDSPMFTSGHQNSFGVPMEESSTYASYNTRVSPTLPSIIGRSSVETTTSKANVTEDPGLCQSTRLQMCRGVLPYDLTTNLPLITGIANNNDLQAALPYFEFILRSGCSLRSRQFICTLLEPECKPKGMKVLPPCRRACKAVTESCEEVILQTIELAPIFQCEQYPDFNEPSKCVNLAKHQCMANEYHCPIDDSCIPNYWRCDGIPDCPGDTDESNCTECKPDEFRCGENSPMCVPRAWQCDGFVDCSDGADERGCGQLAGAAEERETPTAAESAHPAPVLLPHPNLHKLITPTNKLPSRPIGSPPQHKSRMQYDQGHPEQIQNEPSPQETIIGSQEEENRPTDGLKTVKIRPTDGVQDYTKSTTNRLVQYSRHPIRHQTQPPADASTSRPASVLPMGGDTGSLNSKSSDHESQELLMMSDTVPTRRNPVNPKYQQTSARLYQNTRLSSKNPKHVRTSAEQSSHSSPCPQGELRCVEGRCITVSQLCDGTKDCSDGADETNCYF